MASSDQTGDLLAKQLAIADLAERAARETPGLGWTVGQVCAHLILNNGLFIETARAVERGERPGYDNVSSVDDTVTAVLAAGAGSLATIAGWLRTSVTEYAAVLLAFPDRVLDAEVVTTIRSDGSPVVDRQPRRLGDLMVGQLTFHAGMHLEQVQTLVGA
jgi:hypothetical protein